MIQVGRFSAVRASTGCGGDDDDDAGLSSLINECSDTSTDGGSADASSSTGASVEGDRQGASTKARKAAKRITALLGHGTADDPVRLMLADDVAKAAEEMAALRTNRPAFRPALASRLREAGYDAAVCGTRWRGTSEVADGSYEYIDVVTAATGKATAPGKRYIVDVGFVQEFAVARPTLEHALVLGALPRMLVARAEVVQQVVKLASKAARRSLKSQGLTVPPWRKKRYMAAKWLGPHRRMDNTATGARSAVGEATCRTVGFLLGPPQEPWLS